MVELKHGAELQWRLTTPVVLAIFNRPDTTAQIMQAIRLAQPAVLLIIADGPRPEVVGEAVKCSAALELAMRVDWDCEVRTNISKVHLGLRRRIQSGLQWVFEQVEEAIILEDDCLPHPTFFRFCEEMLERYRDEPLIFAISGSNFQFGTTRGEASYYFSRYPHIWGWATWRRSWNLYDGDLGNWPSVRDTPWLETLGDPTAISYWNYLFDKTHGGLDTWDYQLVFTAWLHGALSIVPAVNLVSNLGFRADATHAGNTVGGDYAEMPIEAISFPLLHPTHIARDEVADDLTEANIFSGNLKRRFRDLYARTRSKG